MKKTTSTTRRSQLDRQGLCTLFGMSVYCWASFALPGGLERPFLSPWHGFSLALALVFTSILVTCFMLVDYGHRWLRVWVAATSLVFSAFISAGLVAKGYDIYCAWMFWPFLNVAATSVVPLRFSLNVALINFGMMVAAHIFADPSAMPYPWWFYFFTGISIIFISYEVLRRAKDIRAELYKSQLLLEAKTREVEAILNSVGAMIAYKNTENVFVNLNDALATRMGIKKEHGIGSSMYDMIAYREAKAFHDQDLEIIHSGQAQINVLEEVHFPNDLGKVWLRSTKTPLFDDNNNAIGIVIHSEDVTEIIKVQQDLQQKEQKLLAYSHQLEDSNQNLQEFAYVISHDLREPLRTITAYTQLLKRRIKPEIMTPEMQDFMHFIVDAAKRMDGQINGILEYSRVGRTELERQDLSLIAEIKTVESILKTQINDTGASIKLVNLDNVTVCADQMHLVLLLQNLVSNAIKYRKPEVAPILQISANRYEQGWQISLSDNGIGIEPQYLDTIFGVFRRLHTRTDIEGSGIGLSICRRIVQRHGGKIWAASVFGEGTKFVFTLPD